MKKLIYIAFLILFFNCASKKTTTSETKEVVKTHTVTEEIKLDTTLFIPGEKATLFIPNSDLILPENTKQKVFTKQSGRASVTAKIGAKGINVSANCDSIAKQLSFYKKKVTQYQVAETETKTKEKEKKGYTFFELILYLIAVAITAFVAGYFTHKLKFKTL